MMTANCRTIVVLSDLTLSMDAALSSSGKRGLKLSDDDDVLVARDGGHIAHGSASTLHKLQHFDIRCFHRRGSERIAERLFYPEGAVALRVHPQRLDDKAGQGGLIIHGCEPHVAAEFLVAKVDFTHVLRGQFHVRVGDDVNVRAARGCTSE